MAVNKVVMNTENGEDILIDLTNDTVTPKTLAKGATAHNASGDEIVGEMPTETILYTEQTLTEAQKEQARENIGIDEEFKADITRMVIESLGGNPVFGYVDKNNNVILSGNLADGTYSIKYEMEDGTIDIGNLVLDTNVYYSVTSNLTNCENSNSTKEVVEGESYSATITANSGYELKTVTVTMGGQNVSVSGGDISIVNVTGDIVITAVAELAGPSYTNQIPLSIGVDGKPFNNGQGYKTGYRLSLSGGGESAQEGTEVTGFIPVTKNSVIRIKNIAYSGDTTRGVVGYDANFTKVGSAAIDAMFTTYGEDDGNGVRRTKLNSFASFYSDSLKYIRLCSTDINANSIITVDQEIV